MVKHEEGVTIKKEKRDVVKEFDDYFGDYSKLSNWQMLCRDLDIEGDLGSLTKCKNVRIPLSAPSLELC